MIGGRGSHFAWFKVKAKPNGGKDLRKKSLLARWRLFNDHIPHRRPFDASPLG
jgi:hypothetical protein